MQSDRVNKVNIAYTFYMCRFYRSEQVPGQVLLVYPDYMSGNIVTLYLDTIGV